uniref:Uncharacterized protein n=1 Tax=Setaria digitata TaxID=48799 RepID=A0A915PKP3_9BILA
MMRVNGAIILSQLWIIISSRGTNNDDKGLTIIREISFLPVSQRTPRTSFLLNNLTQQSQQQRDERHLLTDRNRRFQHYQQGRDEEISFGKKQDNIEVSVSEPFIKFPVVTFLQTYASNDTRLIPPANSNILENVAFPSLPNKEVHGKVRLVSNSTQVPEENDIGDKKDEDDNGLDNNAVDVELEMRRKMKRTTIEVRSYPPVTEATLSPAIANAISVDPGNVTPLSVLTTSTSTSSFRRQQSIDSRFRTTVPYQKPHHSPLPLAVQNKDRNWEIVQRLDTTELPVIASLIGASAPIALPMPLDNSGTLLNRFDTQLQNSGFSELISDEHFWTSGRIEPKSAGTAVEQRPSGKKVEVPAEVREQQPVDDVLGCAWDIVTNSCKDLFSLRLCSHCHDFGSIFLHNCKCLVKHTTVF